LRTPRDRGSRLPPPQERELFAEDAALTRAWDEEIAGGKWRHFMDQTHLGYTTWQQPVANALPAVTELQVPAPPELGVAVAGDTGAWPSDDPGRPPPRVPPIDPFNDQERRVDVFNRGGTRFRFTAHAAEPWLVVSPRQGEVALETALSIRVDWERAPVGRHQGSVTIEGPAGRTVTVGVPLFRPPALTPDDLEGFVEADGYVAFDASDFTRATADGEVHWEIRWSSTGSSSTPAACVRVISGRRGAVGGGNRCGLPVQGWQGLGTVYHGNDVDLVPFDVVDDPERALDDLADALQIVFRHDSPG